MWRTVVAVLAGAILLIAVLIGSNLIGQRQQQTQAQSTRTAQTATAARQTAAAQTTATSATTPTTTATTTATTSASPTSTPVMSADMTTPPPPPAGAGTNVLTDPAPGCDQAQATWTKDNATGFACNSAGLPTITAQSSSQSACIEQPTTILADGYFEVIAQPQSGGAILAFREGNGQSSSTATVTTTNITGYFFKVDRSAGNYALARFDASGQATIVKQGHLPASLAPHFALGVLFKGGAITLYINGVQLDSATDTTFTSGYIGLCTDGMVTFSHAQAYTAS